VILEVQAVAPTNARSWFIGQEVVAGSVSQILYSFSEALSSQSRWKTPSHDPNRPRISSHPNPPIRLSRGPEKNLLRNQRLISTQENGDQGMFRPADEIFEDAAANLEQSSTSAADKDVSLLVSKEDVFQFASMECCINALKRVCDVKGARLHSNLFFGSS
jgi:ribonuclease H2 subunit B